DGQSSKLVDRYIECLQKQHRELRLVTRDLAADPVPRLTLGRFQALLAKPEERSVEQQTIHPDYVFTYRQWKTVDGVRVLAKNCPVAKMNNTAWKRAWRAAGLPADNAYRRGPHNLKHTFGRRLRAAGVPLETRKVLLGHTNGDITTRYSAAEVGELIEAAERVCGDNSRKTPALTLIRKK
ncbi:MAG TPA: tyrosine-type recombinase/integrase, partial [Gammaproteobacteria bacterium]|nr:tyrosine-type recombinase/integrase [Gammaproteobacteria bacterium]